MKFPRSVIRSIAALSAAVTLLAGCGDGSAAKNAANIPPEDPSLQDAVLIVNGEKVTRGECEKMLKLTELLATNRRKMPAKRLEMFLSRSRARLIPSLVPKMLLCQKAKADGVKIFPEVLEKYENRYAKTFGGTNETYASLKTKLGDYAQILNAAVEREALAESCLRVAFSNDFAITEADVTNAIARAKAGNVRSAATNAWAWATASNVLGRASSGYDFSKLASEFSQDPEEEKRAIEFECDATDYPSVDGALWGRVESLKRGEISDILNCGDALHVVKKTRIVQDPDAAELKHHFIERVVLRLAGFYPDYTREDILKLGEKQALERGTRKLVKELEKSAKIEYPQGKDVFGNKRNKNRRAVK